MSLLFRRSLDWGDVYGGSPGWSGVRFVGGKTTGPALRVAPVYAAVALIADQFATLPQHVFVGTDGARRKVDTPDWLRKPDPRVGLLPWLFQYTVSLKLRGNAYGLVFTAPNGRVAQVKWLHPDKVEVDETDAEGPRYRMSNGKVETLWSQGGRIIHVPEFVQPGSVVGLSPIQQFASTIETATAATEYGRNWFGKNATPTSLMMSKKRLVQGQAKEAKRLMREAIADGGPVVLDGMEWDYTKLSVTPDEAKFLDTIRATATTIATIFRVPPDDIGGDAAASRTYGNREADAERFNARTLLPHCVRYEQAIGELLSPGEFLKCNLDALVRPSLLDRSRANTENLRNGTLTLPEARAQEDRPPLSAQEIEQWQAWYQTNRTVAETVAETVTQEIKETR